MTRDATTAFARALVDEWVRAGMTDACLAPGSRSAPLALAFAQDGRVRVHVHLDERSASFFALGIALASRRPVALLCTSGTAAANFHPAVLEAAHARVPLVVCTADRPSELRDAGAGQTIDQAKLYGDAVRWYHDPGVPDDRPGVGTVWRQALRRARDATASGPPAGPVHLNLPFREPLVPTGAELVEAPGRADGRPWTESVAVVAQPTDEMVARLCGVVRRALRGVLVAGWNARVPRGNRGPLRARCRVARPRGRRVGCACRRTGSELLRGVAANGPVRVRGTPGPRPSDRRGTHVQDACDLARRGRRTAARRCRRRVARPAPPRDGAIRGRCGRIARGGGRGARRR